MLRADPGWVDNRAVYGCLPHIEEVPDETDLVKWNGLPMPWDSFARWSSPGAQRHGPDHCSVCQILRSRICRPGLHN